MAAGRVLIYGGKGALGSKCVAHFKANQYWVASIDLTDNSEADYSITVGKEDDFTTQESTITTTVSKALGENKLDAIICVAGGWAGGNASKDLVKNAEMMWKQSGWSSLISAALAAKYLNEGGVVVLTGAKAALDPTPGMIGYGVAKAAVHQLVSSLGAEGSGLPKDSLATAILPVTLDTPMNRKWMPNGDFASWTPLEFVAELFVKWTKKEDRPKNGALCQLITKDSKTEIIPA